MSLPRILECRIFPGRRWGWETSFVCSVRWKVSSSWSFKEKVVWTSVLRLRQLNFWKVFKIHQKSCSSVTSCSSFCWKRRRTEAFSREDHIVFVLLSDVNRLNGTTPELAVTLSATFPPSYSVPKHTTRIYTGVEILPRTIPRPWVRHKQVTYLFTYDWSTQSYISLPVGVGYGERRVTQHVRCSRKETVRGPGPVWRRGASTWDGLVDGVTGPTRGRVVTRKGSFVSEEEVPGRAYVVEIEEYLERVCWNKVLINVT